MWRDFGGHPTLHHYNYLMSKQHQKDLLREAEHERMLHEVNEKPGALHLYYAWLYEVGWYIENCRRSLMKFGKFRERQASSRSTVADLHSLKVIHVEPARRTKWN
jgi:hypothetical protein